MSKAQELHQALVDAVARLTSDNDWTAVLDLWSRFHRYSFVNTLLMWAQRDNVTAVAGYQQWRERFNRQVRKGETGMSIYYPRFAEDDDDGDPVGFGVTKVFDVTQTQAMCPDCRATVPYRQANKDAGHRRGGWLTDDEKATIEACQRCDGTGLDPDDPPLPTALDFADNPNGYEPDGLWPALQGISQSLGYGLPSIENMGGGMKNGSPDGVTNFKNRTIKIERDQTDPMKSKTLVHELAHAMMHDPKLADAGNDRGIMEVEAESVAYIVCTALGFTSPDFSFPYVAKWAGSDPKVIEKVGDRVTKTAQALLDLIAQFEPTLAVAA